jgi:hypothetical protein
MYKKNYFHSEFFKIQKRVEKVREYFFFREKKI